MMQEILPFLRENGNDTWKRFLDAFGSKKAKEFAGLPRNEIMIKLRVEDQWSLQAVADLFGLSRERIRQLTPPNIWYREEKQTIDRQSIENALRRALSTKEAWATKETLSNEWMSEQMGVPFLRNMVDSTDKFYIFTTYGLKLVTREEKLEWLNKKYFTEGMSYAELAKYLSRTFVSISTMAVYHGCKKLGFKGRERGRMPHKDYLLDI